MPDLRIEKIPEDLYHDLKVKAAQEDMTIKAFVIALIEKAVGRKAGLSASSEALLNKYAPARKAGKA